MLKNKLLILIFSILITNCDYSPVYVKNDNLRYSLNISEVTGDSEINKYIIKELNLQSSNNSEKKFNIRINTSFLKMF